MIRQVFVARGSNDMDQDALERKLYIIRKKSGHAIQALKLRHGKEFYVPSMSTRTLVYKGMLLAHQVGEYYLDLQGRAHGVGAGDGAPALLDEHLPDLGSRAPVPPRLPQRRDQHAARQRQLDPRPQHGIASTVLGEDLDKIWPLIYDGQSDSASFDNALELLLMGGYPLAHAMMMMIPEAWAGNPLMDEDRRAFYEYNAALMEPWDGPAAMAFTDGRQIGATLDRNGLRPARFVVTDDDYMVMALGGRRAPHPRAQDRHEVATPAGQDVPGRHGAGPYRRGRRVEAHARRRPGRIAGGSTARGSRSTPAGPAPPPGSAVPCSTASRRSPTRRRTSSSS